MKTLEQWLDQYSISHQNHRNQVIHKLCVPLIFFSVLGMLWDLQLFGIRSAFIFAILGMLFYIQLGFKTALLMLFQFAVSFAILTFWGQRFGNLFVPSLTIFILGWIGQFIGHHIEGKKPSFFEDLQFLLIGPVWVFSFIFSSKS